MPLHRISVAILLAAFVFLAGFLLDEPTAPSRPQQYAPAKTQPAQPPRLEPKLAAIALAAAHPYGKD